MDLTPEPEHPSLLGMFVVRVRLDREIGRDVVTCDHCHDLYPCDTALEMHGCEQSIFCTDDRCDFREAWKVNRPEIVQDQQPGGE